VLLFGESAGAQDTLVHVASPLSKGLFAAAAVESGGVYTTTLAQGETAMQVVVDGVGCGADGDVLTCMRGKSFESLVKVPSAGGPLAKGALRYTPLIDGHVLKGSALEIITAGTHNHVPLIIGTNADETSKMVAKVTTEAEYAAAVQAQYGAAAAAVLLQQYPASAYATPRAALIRLTTDATWTCPIRRLSRAAAQHQTEPVFRYHFSWKAPGAAGAAVGATHGIELPFVFNTFAAFSGFQPSAADQQLADAMQKYWVGLAGTGDPNGAGRVAWPSYDAATDPYLELDAPISAAAGLSTANCDFIESLAP
jgi:para-nitrobenzyl esterase